MTTTTSRRAVRPVVVAALLLLLAVLASATVIVLRTRAEGAGDRPVRVLPADALAATGVEPRGAVLRFAVDRPTSVTVVLTRTATAPAVPALRADFDGSGGGEAVRVACTSPAVEWVVGVGSAQTAELTCDRAVEPWRLNGLQYVRLDLAG